MRKPIQHRSRSMLARRGAAILLATLAAAIVATAAIAILRAGQRQVLTTKAIEDVIRGDHEARALIELSIATLRQNPGFVGEIRNKNAKSSQAFAIVTATKAGFGIEVFLYNGSPVAAQSISIDSSVLAAKG